MLMRSGKSACDRLPEHGRLAAGGRRLCQRPSGVLSVARGKPDPGCTQRRSIASIFRCVRMPGLVGPTFDARNFSLDLAPAALAVKRTLTGAFRISSVYVSSAPSRVAGRRCATPLRRQSISSLTSPDSHPRRAAIDSVLRADGRERSAAEMGAGRHRLDHA